MKKFIPYEKLSKKQKRELDLKKRGTWGAVSPISRKAESKKLYNRAKTKHSVEHSAECYCFTAESSLQFFPTAIL